MKKSSWSVILSVHLLTQDWIGIYETLKPNWMFYRWKDGMKMAPSWKRIRQKDRSKNTHTSVRILSALLKRRWLVVGLDKISRFMSWFLQQQSHHHKSHFLMGNSNEVQVFRIHQPQNAEQSLIRLSTAVKTIYTANIKSWESTNHPNNFLIAPPFSMNINYSQLSMHSCVWIFLYRQHLMWNSFQLLF